MNTRPIPQSDPENRNKKFNIRTAFAAGLFCAAAAFLVAVTTETFAGIDWPVKMVAAIHFGLASGVLSGFATATWAGDDPDDVPRPTK